MPSMMQILWPKVEFGQAHPRLAVRLPALAGRRIAFLDGWGERHGDGSFTMYPLMQALRELLVVRYPLGGTGWWKKPAISIAAPPAMFQEVLQQADAVVNGVCA